jgi:hypothetical protein
LIKEVNEAYDVLGDAEKRHSYDYQLENPYASVFTPPEPVHRDPAYKRKADRTYVHVSKEPSQRDIMERYVHFARKVTWAGFMLFFILMLDFVLPHHIVHDTIKGFSNRGGGRYEANYLITHSGEHIKIGLSDGFFFGMEQPIEIVKSRLFSILIEIRIPENEKVVTNLSTIYANFRFVLWILGSFSIVGLLVKEGTEFRFNLGIMTFFVLMFAIFLLIK